MRRHKKLIAFVVLLVVTLSVGLFAYIGQHHRKKGPIGLPSYAVTIQGTPEASHQAADAYLIAKVGTENFARFYTYDHGRGGYANAQDPPDESYDFIAYHFSPFHTDFRYDDVVMVQVNRNHPSVIYADGIPDCVIDSSQCTSAVTEAQALAIAEQHGIRGPFTGVSWNEYREEEKAPGGLQLTIDVQSCTQKKQIAIDYRNGNVLKTEDITDYCNHPPEL